MTTLSDWIEVARTGRFRDMSGQDVDVTPERLDRVAGSLRSDNQAALVFGHPELDAPAYGWVADLKRHGDKLLARFRDVPEEVKRLVKAGRYRNVSMRVDKDWTLRHVGLLGAAAPAIDGLAPVQFAGDAVTIEFSTAQQPAAGVANQPEGRRMDPAQLQGQIDALRKENEDLKAQLAEAAKGKEKAEAEKAEADKAFAAYKAKQVESSREARFAALVKDGKVLPADKAQVMAFAAALEIGGKEASGATTTLAFAAPDGTAEQVTPEEAFWRNLESGQPHGLFRHFAAPAQPSETDDIPTGDLAGKF